MSMEGIFSEPHDGKVHVHVDNFEDATPAVKTEEREPEHFNAVTFVLTAGTTQGSMGGGTSRNDIAQVLAEDLLRKDAAIYAVDTPVVLCATYRQAQDPANQATGVPFPQGAYLAAGGNASLAGTGPLWVVNTTPATPCRVSVIVNRR